MSSNMIIVNANLNQLFRSIHWIQFGIHKKGKMDNYSSKKSKSKVSHLKTPRIWTEADNKITHPPKTQNYCPKSESQV